ncbi:hypothetical protein SAMN04488543_1311 [Friedmanniella luteola]|uniref:Uncharacterized protein n=1 Tax=Friedmanniella luteola TaxID=546871 RepID=A0A1H1QFG1_9ACTN|nr:hypothetical protein [Friedmanniella luteola]SDS22238.1 hypothetical protein SAMN04488543_1311 [Friedmanniella luteola]
MGIYASRPGRRAGQLLGDGLVLAWVVLWAVVGVVVDRTVSLLAGPARETARTAERIAGTFSDAAGEAGQVPGLGEQLRRPFDSASGSLGDLIASAERTVVVVERIAALTGWLTFLVPVAVVLALWLPRRIRFHRRARAAQAFLDSSADLDLFALRALAAQPVHVLARISPDPVAAWRAGDRAVITRLAEVELHRSGLDLPAELRVPTPAGRAG